MDMHARVSRELLRNYDEARPLAEGEVGGKEITGGVCKVERMDKLVRLSSGESPGIITQSDAKCHSRVIMRK